MIYGAFSPQYLTPQSLRKAQQPQVQFQGREEEDQKHNALIKAARAGDPEAQQKLNGSATVLASWFANSPLVAQEVSASATVNWQYAGPFYRIIGESELRLLLSGQIVQSDRETHGGYRTDITNNPDYGQVSRIDKYRVEFAQTDKFDPALRLDPKQPHTGPNNESERKYFLYGGYSLPDVARITRFDDGRWETCDIAELKRKLGIR